MPDTAVQVHLAHADPVPLAVIRRRVRPSELSVVVPQGCGLVWQFVRSRGLRGGRHVAVYLNGDIQLEVGVEMPDAFVEEEGVFRSTTPAGLAASATYFGPYQQLGRAHEAIRLWCRANGHETSGPNWEIYGHWLPEWNNNPSLIRTDVFYQVRSR